MPDKRVTELTSIDAVTGSDLVMVIDDPAGTPVNKKATVNQILVNVAKTDVSNTFTGDQTVDGDLFVTGEVNPAVFARQVPKINALAGGSVGDPSGSRTLLSKSLVSGLSLRHDEALAEGRLSVGNYDTQIYQPLKVEVESFQVHTGVSPGVRAEHLRVHPTGGVTVGATHVVDPGVGGLRLGSLDLTEGVPLNPAPDTARLYALDVNGYTQVEMRDGNAKVVRFASDNILIAKVTGVAITRGQCIYLAGASGANPLVGLARADALATMPGVGLALDSGAVNAFIRVLVAGTLQLLDTSAFAEGARLYVSPTTAGALTTTLPVAPAYAQRVGVVTRSNAMQGEVLVQPTSVDGPPRLHATTHNVGGSDALTVTALGGFPGGTGTFLRADGTFAAPAAAGGGDVYLNAANVFTEDQTISKSVPRMGFNHATGPAGSKLWRIASNGGQILFAAMNDDGAAAQTVPLTLNRDASVGLVGNLTIAKVRPELVLQTTGDTAKGRVFSAVAGGRVDITSNFYYTGSAWSQDDTSKGGGLLVVDAGRIDAYTVSQPGVLTARLTLADTGKITVGGQLLMINSATYADLGFYSGGYAAGTRYCKLQHSAGNLNLYMLDDGDTAIQSVPMTWYRDGNVNVGGSQTVGIHLTASGCIRSQGARSTPIGGVGPGIELFFQSGIGYVHCYDVGTGAYPPMYLWTSNLVTRPGCVHNFDGNIYGRDIYSSTPMYPGREDTGWTHQASWYLASHASYGLKSNTGLYLAGSFWLAGTANMASISCQNINTNGYNLTTGTLNVSSTTTFPVSVWINSSEGYQRLHFASSSITYVKGHGITFRNLSDQDIATIDIPGNLWFAGNIGCATNTWRSNFHNQGYVYPGSITEGGVQTSWYVAGHSSYGLYINTGLYVVGAVWPDAIYMRGFLTVNTTHNWYSGRYVGAPDNGVLPTHAVSGQGGTNNGFIEMRNSAGQAIFIPYWL